MWMTVSRADFSDAYIGGKTRTERLLVSRGAALDRAVEIAQAAWCRGWERRSQLRNSKALQYWVNSIALNMLRDERRSTMWEDVTVLEQVSRQQSLDAPLMA